MLDHTTLSQIIRKFGLTVSRTAQFVDTSRGEDDNRWNYLLDERYVLKMQSPQSVWEARLQQISRLIERYRSIGVYCPGLIPTSAGPLSCQWEIGGKPYTCFVEEFAQYPVCPDERNLDRKEVVAHLGVLAAKYSGVDLSETRSMWSIIDLAPLDADIDEKQENANTLVKTLGETGFPGLAAQVNAWNYELRERIRKDYQALPRCVFQGDLNSGNLLHRDGHFAGLIDFNLSGTDVNINVFVNETNWFPDGQEFAAMTVSDIVAEMDSRQEGLLAVIWEAYTMKDLERRLFPCYKRICDLFQYPNVCRMVKWLKDSACRDKCAALIRTLIERPL